MDELEERLKIDREKIRVSVGLQLPIEMTSYTLPRNTEVYIRNIMEMFLEECHQDHLKEYLNFCLSELLTNSKKANTKRVSDDFDITSSKEDGTTVRASFNLTYLKDGSQ